MRRPTLDEKLAIPAVKCMMASGGYGTRRLCPDVLTKYILTLDTHILVDFLGSVEKKGPKGCVVTLADSAECSANQIREVARWH